MRSSSRTAEWLRPVALGVLLGGAALLPLAAEAQSILHVPGDYATIQAALDAAAPLDTVQVAAGTYAENLVITKPGTLLGPNAGKAGWDPSRSAEALLVPATVGPYIGNPDTSTTILRITVSGVTVRGFAFDGHNPALSGGVVMDGVEVHATTGVSNYADDHGYAVALSGAVVEDSTFAHFGYCGVDLEGSAAAATVDCTVRNNAFTSIDPGETPVYGWGVGILLAENGYADVLDNRGTDLRKGVQTNNFYRANTGTTGRIQGNDFETWRYGLYHNLHYAQASPFTVAGNTFRAAAASTTNRGLGLSSLQGDAGAVLQDNAILGGFAGIEAWNLPVTTPLTVQGGSATGCQYGLLLWNNQVPGYGSSSGTSLLTVSGTRFSGSTAAGIRLFDDPANANSPSGLTLALSGATVEGGPVGILVDGADALLASAQGCTLTGAGTAVLTQNGGTAALRLSRIAGNAVGCDAPSGAVDAADCWWGCNAGPGYGGCDTVTGSVTFGPWLTLSLAALPTTVAAGGGTAALDANLFTDSASADLSGAGLFPSGPGVLFGASLGTATSPVGLTGGSAASTFTSGPVPGTASVSATLDAQSVSASLLVVAPAPVLSGLSPARLAPGQPAFTLTVDGSGFLSGATVLWNGAARTTTFVSATQLTAAIGASDIASAGSFPVTVLNPAPTTGPSNALDFTVSSPAEVWVDDDWAGSLPGDAVGGHTFGSDAFATVQLAVDGVSDGGTIHVAGGTYTGTVDIENRSGIDLVGEGRDTVLLRPSSTLVWNATYPSRRVALRVVNSTGIDLSGITLDLVTVRGNQVSGVLYWNATGTLDANRYRNVSPTNPSSVSSLTVHARAVDPPYTESNRAQVAFTNSEFIDTGRVAINFHNWVHLTITGNTFRQNVNQTGTFGYGLEVGSTATATVSGNAFSGYNVAAGDGSESAGIYIENAFTTGLRGGPEVAKPVSVTGNDISGCQYGLWIGNGYSGYAGPVKIATTFTGNTVRDISPAVAGGSSGGLFLEDADRAYGSSNTLVASGNTFRGVTGPAYRFYTLGDGELHASVTGDVLTGCSAAFTAEEYAGATSHDSVYDLALHFCRIAGNAGPAQNLLDGAYYPAPVQAQNNWWGCNFGPGGTGAGCTGANGVSGAIAHDPWLVLALTAAPEAVAAGGTSNLLSDFFRDNHGATVVGGTIPDGTPVAFAGILGTVADGLLGTAGGQASTVFTAGGAAGAPGASVTVDGQTLTAITVQNPAPVLTSLSPALLAPGQPAFTLTVGGSGFVSGATVYWNGAARATTFASDTQLTASISAADVAAVGVYPVTVSNPAPSAGPSNALEFTVAYPPVVWVDDGWGAEPLGADPDGAGPATHIGYDAFAAVQRGVSAVATGGTVEVLAGSYREEVTLARAVLLRGAGMDAVTLTGPYDTGGANTLSLAASGVTVEGLTITRDGNAPATWAANRKSQGVHFAQGITGCTLRRCRLTGNRNAVYINTAQGNTVRENLITFNRTGVQLVNDVTGTLVTQNEITDNWTLGVLFNTVLPAETSATTPLVVRENRIEGNWYGQVECRWTLSTATLDVSANWLGSTALTVRNTNAGEPGYATQIPVAYGGTAADPGGASSVGGVTSDRIDYTPWLHAGTDAAPATPGFQGDHSYLHAGPLCPQAGATPRVAEAIGLVTSGGTVALDPGVFVENVVVPKPLTLAGAGAASTTLYPALSDPNCGGAGGGSLCAGASNLLLVQADGVRVHGLTLDGDNPALASGVVVNGADLDARNGIITNHPMGAFQNLTVYDCAVRNIYLRGIYASSGGSFYIHDNTVDNVAAEYASIALFNYGGGGALTDGSGMTSSFVGNTVSRANDAISANWSRGTQFLNNVVTASGSGVHTDNNGGYGGVADLLQGNTVTDSAADGYGVWVFAPYLPVSVLDNTVTGVDVGLAASGSAVAPAPLVTFSGNQVDGQGKAGSVAAYVTTSEFGWGYADVSALFTGNRLVNGEIGIYIERSVGNAYTAEVVAHGNDLSGNTASGVDNSAEGVMTTADATCNWWGSATGPVHPWNPLGTGSAASDYVTFEKWSTVGTEPYDCLGCIPPDTTITAAPAVCALSEGNAASVPVPAAGGSFAWTIANGTITAGDGTDTITYTAGATGPVTLGVTVTKSDTGCARASSQEVAVNARPEAVITAEVAVVSGTAGHPASVPEVAGDTYAWTITNGTITSGADTAAITYSAGDGGLLTLGVTVTRTASGCTSTGTFPVTVHALMPEVSGLGAPDFPLMATRDETDWNRVDLRFQSVGGIRYNLYVSNSPVTRPFAVTDPAYGQRQCAVRAAPEGGGFMAVPDLVLETGITGGTELLFFLVTADSAFPGTEGPLGLDSSGLPRGADSSCNP